MARKRNQGSNWIRREKRLAIYLRDGLCCVYCAEEFEVSAQGLTLDHVVPCELGGNNSEGNLVTCCLSCNSSKQAKTTREWFQALRDKGVNTDKIGARIRRLTRRSLKSYKTAAKQVLRDRV
jgi:5-methylcytosine-specific restriction endonuclease McrA